MAIWKFLANLSAPCPFSTPPGPPPPHQYEIGCDEVYDGDSVAIPQFGQEQDFKANIYRLDKPYYLPFLSKINTILQVH